MLYGVFFGLMTWIPYLFVWLPLWGMFMVIGMFNLPLVAKVPVYMILCALHGLSFGTLYAPFAALLFGIPLRLNTMLAWIAAGFPFDIAHALGNLAAGVLIVPLTELLKKLNAQVLGKEKSGA
jgi:energy-coupling factor transport system substrate-specific component